PCALNMSERMCRESVSEFAGIWRAGTHIACDGGVGRTNSFIRERGTAQRADGAGDPAKSGSTPAVLLRLGRAGRALLHRLCAAGPGGCDAFGLCRAADPRVRLVAHGAVRCSLTRRTAGRARLTADRSDARPPGLAARALPRGAGQ